MHELNLSNIATDDYVPLLGDLPNLWSLDLSNSEVTDWGLSRLPLLLDLVELEIDNAEITDAGLAHLHKFSGLQHVSAHGKRGVTREGLMNLARALPRCQVWVPDVGHRCPQCELML
jgi:hypothetical protein